MSYEEIKRPADNWSKPRLDERRAGFHRLTQAKLGEIANKGWPPSPRTYALVENLAHEELEQRGQIIFEGCKKAIIAAREPIMPLFPQIKSDFDAALLEESMNVRQGIQYVCDSCKPPAPKDASGLLARISQKLTSELEFLCMTQHNDRDEGIPIFPFKPSSVKMTSFRVYEQGQLAQPEHVDLLIRRLFLEAETAIKYYYQDGTEMDPLLAQAIRSGDIILAKSEFRYFKHPEIAHDYIKIEKDEVVEEWQKETARRTPEFVEAKLELSGRKRAELDTINKVHLEERVREELKRQKWAFDVFLSYSERDRDAASLIHEKVTAAGGRLYMAPKELSPGDDFAEAIRNALVHSGELWLLVSPRSIASEWVTSEWGAAWALEKKIVPILYQCSHNDLPDRLRRLQSIDLHLIDGLVTRKFPKSSTL